jgi:heme b synthase
MRTTPLRMIAWEVTRRCNLSCLHCRASAHDEPYQGELSTEEAIRFLEDVASFSRPVVILTGGEPLLREDIDEIARHGTQLGIRMVMATNGTLLSSGRARDLKEAGIQRMSISLDGSKAETHDGFRGVAGAFEGALKGIRSAKEVGLPFQINTTVTQRNLKELPDILDLAVRLGAVAHHIFLLVPTGRGRGLLQEGISAQDYERVLHWFYDQRRVVPLQLKATCAPHYYRILRQRAKKEGRIVSPRQDGLDATTRGCLGGISFCFVSHLGQVQPCGYLELSCGDLRKLPLSEIWAISKVFQQLRDPQLLKGKCGQCEYRRVCGGCRARAYEMTGDYLAEEPLCTYRPARSVHGKS